MPKTCPNLLPSGMKIVARTGCVESHDGDLALKIDGAIELRHDGGEVDEQRLELLDSVILRLHLLDALLQSVVLRREWRHFVLSSFSPFVRSVTDSFSIPVTKTTNLSS